MPFLNGLYFFYEDGEVSEHGPAGRIVRIGNHPRAAEGLVRRLRGHYRSGTGAKNGSVFRRYLGGAILRSRDPISPCLSPGPGAGHWERQDADACHDCRSLEEAVSQLLRSRFRFRCVRIDDPDERNRLESRLIASVAACPVCQPSAQWLGRHAYPDVVQRSGLWNSQGVGGATPDADDFASFRRLVAASVPSGASVTSLNDTMLIIPCSSAKAGAQDPALPVVRIGDLLGPDAAATLEE
ncbi:MAG: hypothetical protein ACRDJO_03195, partial [Actinomycetota bacterium]